MRGVPLILLVAACYRSSPAEPTSLANHSETRDPPPLTMSSHGVGPIDGGSKATLMELRATLLGYDIRPVNDGSLQYDVYRNGERLAYIVPDDNTGLVFNIHVVSSRVAVSGHPWRVGEPFGDAAHLVTCECWGSNPTCYAPGEHIAVNFARECEGLIDTDRRALRVLDGTAVQRVIWSPTPFGEDYGEDRD